MASIEHVAIFAADLEHLRRFYQDAFGLDVAVDNSRAPVPGYFLRGERGSALEIIARPAGSGVVDQRYVCHVAFTVDDVAATQVALERRGVCFETDTAVNTPDVRTAFFRDPEGNRCQIIWRKTRLDGPRDE
jgi:glyoxylase I family protein